jgi:GH3 auxin-responsive promoter
MAEPLCTAVNACWLAAAFPARRRFLTALRRPREEQERRLRTYLRANSQTAFGLEHRFDRIRTVDEYQARVPVRTYDETEPWIRRVAGGHRNVLTSDAVERLVPSGGSTSAAKLIPFTRTLRSEFGRAVDAWIAELFRRHPSLMGGPAYWSISPPAAVAPHPAGVAIPVGFDSDSRYLGGTRHALAETVMAVSPRIARLENPDAFRYATLLSLLARRELRLVSVWHPSFFERLLDIWRQHRARLLRDVEYGTCTFPAGSVGADAVRTNDFRPPDPERARELRRLPQDPSGLWPRLGLISCWGDGPAHPAAERLGRLFAGVPLQTKGLLATEGIVSFPFGIHRPLAVLSHFFEFIDASGGFHLADELSEGAEYSVVLTTGGGLYRYRLGDRVRVDGFVHGTPSISFVGRDDRVSDWCGEKLSESFVARVLDSVFESPRPAFALVAPERTPAGLAYTLFAEARPDDRDAIGARLEAGLRGNPHYAWCVDLGQLQRSRVVCVAAGADKAYLDACAARGQRLGDIKPALLRSEIGWGALLPCTREAPIQSA